MIVSPASRSSRARYVGCTRAQPRRDGAAGFLLTETLATFTISAFVLLGLVSASSVLLRAVDLSVAHVQDVDDLGRTLNAIRRDISGLSRARWNGYEPQAFVFQGGANSLFFAQTERDAYGASETRVIALREIVAGSGTRLMRGDARLSSRATGFDDLRYGPQRELGTGPARLRFAYVMPAGGKAKTAPLNDWPLGQTLPEAIIVEAVARDTGRLILSMRVPIRANADIGCLEREKSPQTAPPPSAALAALNASAVGAGAEQTPNSDAPPPGTPAEAEQSGFCGRVDEDRHKDNQRNAVQPGQPPQSVTGPE